MPAGGAGVTISKEKWEARQPTGRQCLIKMDALHGNHYPPVRDGLDYMTQALGVWKGQVGILPRDKLPIIQKNFPGFVSYKYS